MKKAYRQKKIREIITARSIERQEDLVGALNELGLQVTQATISRDIKEMQLIKVPAENGGYRYALPVMQHRDEPDQLGTTIHDSLVQLKRSDRLLALAVRPGNGPVVANLIRRLTDRGVFTTIGDDSNVLVVCDTADDAQTLADYLNSLVG
ncbi:MAG: ArgR family transcriptional regulator [Limosilactobacillus oris]|jgi:transcriptional regulator of arginine metabolism|uniref:arginine repressor n=1 Tax=Limosilactobacillus oris TaxID=1632 RepID=UPI00174AF822|nr:ArgR family transcriptional regulator [Limosilactobacillus oris]MCH3911531.1 ArgR family transcriptional regulator [Limosilactobacillus oris]MCH3938781.1 ArgR family transcriptional regulator [Limosilactobacillus oris]MCI1980091.1 ArgR family transcriptional regulator [Limosilactobacillus oris]MCI2043479.1 ArgR family transcriptional regulator [Limosilactobacillus oris]UXC67817.1 ArgR family transcriptional regulator [Limosilactobacillus oris]